MSSASGDQSGRLSRPEFADLEPGAPDSAAPWIRRNFELVKNLKVSLSATLGTCEVTVDQLFSFKEGSVVTLDQPVDAMVDLSVDGRVVARGEIVVVDDNFGVRIVELLPAGQDAG